jgi:signal transduction histidine kinase
MSAADDLGRRPLPPDLGRLLHDLRGPLNSLTMHLEVLKRSVHDDAVAEDSLRTVVTQLGRLAEMLPAAFTVAALELGETGPVDLGPVAAAARAEAGGPVTLGAESWPTVVGDRALLTLAVGELLRNAVEATASVAGTRPPTLDASVEGNDVLVVVRDWGRGLRATDGKLPARLLNSTKPGHRGLGLIMVERIARLHGGALRFTSPGDGTIVTLGLKRACTVG